MAKQSNNVRKPKQKLNQMEQKVVKWSKIWMRKILISMEPKSNSFAIWNKNYRKKIHRNSWKGWWRVTSIQQGHKID